jgi:hypothetical protein
VIAGGLVWASSEWSKRHVGLTPRKGGLLCPRHVGRAPADTSGLGRGDFVVLQLQSADGSFSESTWATIVSKTGGHLVAVLSGEQIPEGVRPLHTARHGFRLGEHLVLDEGCVWDVFKPAEFEGRILCGPQVIDLGNFLGEDIFPVAGGLIVDRNDRARIVVGSKESFGNAWHEFLWTRIATISPSGQVITALVEDDPELSSRHGLVRGSVVRFNRDCIIGV